MKYKIWSFEHNAWWGPHRRGYTKEPSEAGVYSLEEANNICLNANILFGHPVEVDGEVYGVMVNEAMVPIKEDEP